MCQLEIIGGPARGHGRIRLVLIEFIQPLGLGSSEAGR